LSKKILVVDDSATIRETLNVTLSDAGYMVSMAKDGADALTMVAADEFDLLMTDLNMPNMDGLQFISAVRKNTSKRFTPIIIISGDPKEQRMSECLSAGASGYLQKPFKQTQVLGILNILVPC
jgi:two-component system chemotaxis response regulator CheY